VLPLRAIHRNGLLGADEHTHVVAQGPQVSAELIGPVQDVPAEVNSHAGYRTGAAAIPPNPRRSDLAARGSRGYL